MTDTISERAKEKAEKLGNATDYYSELCELAVGLGYEGTASPKPR